MHDDFQRAAVRRQRQRLCEGSIRPGERRVDLPFGIVAEIPQRARELAQTHHRAQTHGVRLSDCRAELNGGDASIAARRRVPVLGEPHSLEQKDSSAVPAEVERPRKLLGDRDFNMHVPRCPAPRVVLGRRARHNGPCHGGIRADRLHPLQAPSRHSRLLRESDGTKHNEGARRPRVRQVRPFRGHLHR